MHVRSLSLEDTIVAPATASGEAALAVVRLSGPRSRAIAARLAPSPGGRTSHRLTRAKVYTPDGQLLDEAMVVEMHAPRSYTGDDVVELHLHGAPSVVAAVVAAGVHEGARLAEPGEFTLRAFLRGKLDLAQAEAVASLIGAASEVERRVAAAQLAGDLSTTVASLLSEVEGVLASWRAVLDFPEQVGDDAERVDGREVLTHMRQRLVALVAQARLDLTRKRHIVLCGAPNAGKSSLLNALVGGRRVLVDAAPGTTRDPVEVELAAGGERLSIWDTAGIRADAQGVERAGIELTLARLETADLALWLVAADDPVWPSTSLERPVVLIGSKSDLLDAEGKVALAEAARTRSLPFWGVLSAKSGEGVEALRTRLGAHAPSPPAGEVVVVRERHLEALRQAHAALDRILEGIEGGTTLDVRAYELEQAAKALGAILGRDVDLEVLDRIFADFCLGK